MAVRGKEIQETLTLLHLATTTTTTTAQLFPLAAHTVFRRCCSKVHLDRPPRHCACRVSTPRLSRNCPHAAILRLIHCRMFNPSQKRRRLVARHRQNSQYSHNVITQSLKPSGCGPDHPCLYLSANLRGGTAVSPCYKIQPISWPLSKGFFVPYHNSLPRILLCTNNKFDLRCFKSVRTAA